MMTTWYIHSNICKKKSITHIGLKSNKPRQIETSMGEGEKYNFYVQSDIKEKVVIIYITPTHAGYLM